MLPELSRRLGKIMNTPSMLGLTLEERERFIHAVEKAEKFTDLEIKERSMILRAEREIELLKKTKERKAVTSFLGGVIKETGGKGAF